MEVGLKLIGRLGNPAPLGLLAFGLTTFVLSMYNARIRNVTEPNVILGLALGFGGLGESPTSRKRGACTRAIRASGIRKKLIVQARSSPVSKSFARVTRLAPPPLSRMAGSGSALDVSIFLNSRFSVRLSTPHLVLHPLFRTLSPGSMPRRIYSQTKTDLQAHTATTPPSSTAPSAST